MRSREVGVATELLLRKAEQVSDDGACAAGVPLRALDGVWIGDGSASLSWGVVSGSLRCRSWR
jgi:hypothetical protein